MQFHTTPLQVLVRFGVGEITVSLSENYEYIVINAQDHNLNVGDNAVESEDELRDKIFLQFSNKEQALNVYAAFVNKTVDEVLAKCKEAEKTDDETDKA